MDPLEALRLLCFSEAAGCMLMQFDAEEEQEEPAPGRPQRMPPGNIPPHDAWDDGDDVEFDDDDGFDDDFDEI